MCLSPWAQLGKPAHPPPAESNWRTGMGPKRAEEAEGGIAGDDHFSDEKMISPPGYPSCLSRLLH